MKICVFLLGLVINGASSMNHTLRFLTTASCQISGFPQYVSVGLLNHLEIFHYDNNTKRMEPKQEWMKRMTEDEPQYWETLTQLYQNNEQKPTDDMETIKQLLNKTGGPHVLQHILGCDWDEETGRVRGFLQIAFDGEEFIELDWETQTWVSKHQDSVTKPIRQRLGEAAEWKNRLENFYMDYLKKFVKYGEKTLKRKELPQVWLLQKSSSSPVTCFASGFYPDRAVLFWAKDGEDLQGDWGEILPNHDGTFQSSVSLNLSSVPPGDWGRYSCVFQLSGVTDDLVTKLEPGRIRTNERNFTPYVVAAASVLGAVVCTVIGYFACCRCKDKQLRPESTEPEVMQELNSHPPEAQ